MYRCMDGQMLERMNDARGGIEMRRTKWLKWMNNVNII